MCRTAFEIALFVCWMGSSSTLALVWRAAPNGELPENAVTYKHWSLYHFCKTVGSENTYTGVHRNSENVCKYIAGGVEKEGTEFEVLVRLESEKEHGWKYHSPRDPHVPEDAVKCQHAGIEACYLGLSLYGDGVCDEGIGTIDQKARMMTFPRDGEVRRCPFYMYLVHGGEENGRQSV